MTLAGATVIVGALGALAANAATSEERWPGALDLVRRYPWQGFAALLLLAVVVSVVDVLKQERTARVEGDPPPPPAVVVPDWVVDRAQSRQAVQQVCGGRRAVGISTSLWGAGGFGKTTLANLVCASPRVRRRFRGRVYIVTIGRDVRGPAAIAAKVTEATRFITGDTQEFDNPGLAGAHLGRLLDQRPRTLLVLDDVWEHEQLEPFLHGGETCTRLITTRVPNLLPPGTHQIQVDEMSLAQAKEVLTWQLPPLPNSVTDALLLATGRWALLLRLANRVIADQIATGADVATAAEGLLERLRARGPAGVDDPAPTLDLDNPKHRSLAVRATVEAATTRLPGDGARRFTELAVFAEDEAVPLSLIAQLWRDTGDMTEEQTRTLCRDLQRLSLLSLTPEDGGRINLHDVLRDYLRADLGQKDLTALHATLVETAAARLPTIAPLTSSAPDPGHAWWQLQEGYLLDHLIEHLLEAAHADKAENIASDLRWIEARLAQRGPTAPWSDLTRISTREAAIRARTLAQAAHLLTPTSPPRALTNILHSRLGHFPQWHDQVIARQQDPTLRPLLANQGPLPDTPDPALLRTLTEHTDWVWSVAIAPDSTWLATAGADGTVRIWDAASGTCTATLEGHAGGVESVAIAPNSTWLATGGVDRTVRIWDAASGTCTATLKGHTDWVRSVAIAPDGTWLATADDLGRGRIWDAASGTCTATLEGHTSKVESVAIAPNGTWLATGGADGTVRIWDAASGTCTASLEGDTSGAWSVAIAPDSTWLATASTDGTVRIWDAASGTCTATLKGHTDVVQSVAIAPEGTWLATASVDGTVRIWDVVEERLAVPGQAEGDSGELWSVAIALDGTWLATGGADGTVRIWDAGSGTCTATLEGHTDWVRSVAIAPDGTWLATTDDVGPVRIWDAASGTCTATLKGARGGPRTVAIAPDGTWLATASADMTVRIWDAASGTCTATLEDHAGGVESVAIAPDGTWLASAGTDRTVRIWDAANGTCTATLKGHTSRVESVAIAPDGTWLATASADTTVRIWDTASGTCTATLKGHTDVVQSVAIAPDGTWLATASADETVRVWEIGAVRPAILMRLEFPLSQCVWAADARGLVVVGRAGLYLFKLLP